MFVHKVLYSRLLLQNFIKWKEKLVEGKTCGQLQFSDSRYGTFVTR